MNKVVLLIAGLIGSVLLFIASDVQASCRPILTTTRESCLAKAATCVSQGVILKFAGGGCKKGNKHLGDGGCQCNEYCGYTCGQACVRDPQCYWNKANKKCYNKATHQPGFPIPICPATTSPSTAPTASPTVSPSTSVPTASPSGSKPTVSPTVSAPTLSPSSSAPTASPETPPKPPS